MPSAGNGSKRFYRTDDVTRQDGDLVIVKVMRDGDDDMKYHFAACRSVKIKVYHLGAPVQVDRLVIGTGRGRHLTYVYAGGVLAWSASDHRHSLWG